MKRFSVVALLVIAAGSACANPTLMSSESAAEALHRAKVAMERDPDLRTVPGQILLKFSSNDAQLQSLARSVVNGRTIRELKGVSGLEHLEIGMAVEQALMILNKLPFVEYAEPDYVVHTFATPNDQFVGLQWGVNNTGQDIRGVVGIPDADIDGFEAWDVRTSAANVVVAVIDSGTQWSHPDLDGNIWSNSGEIAGNGIDDDGNGYVDDTRGWDFYNNDNNPDDAEGHGTHVAGTIGAEGNNGIGVAGVAWDVQIMPLRFIGPFGGATSDAIAAVNYAVSNGARISNNSWGGGGFSTPMRDAIASARASDHLFVAAAGNDGVNTDVSPHYPSSYSEDNIISVAATDNRDRLAGFSNYGVNSVDLGAPGVDIASTYSGSGYVWNSGTSMASPHVAGAAALLLAENPSWEDAQIRVQLFSTARATSAMNGTTSIGGVLDLQAALGDGGGNPGNMAPMVSIGSPSNSSTFTEGAAIAFSGSATDPEDGDLSASMAWTSNLDGQIGTGSSFSTSSLSVGSHTVTATVSDSGGISDSDSVTITVEADEPPTSSPPATPGRPSLANLGGGAVGVTWADNSDNETTFEVRRQERVGRQWTNDAIIATTGANTTEYVDNPGNGRWRYRIRAVNDAGASSWSSWRTIRVR